MGIHFLDVACDNCGKSDIVMHNGKPTKQDFENSQFIRDAGGKDRHLCMDCDNSLDDEA